MDGMMDGGGGVSILALSINVLLGKIWFREPPSLQFPRLAKVSCVLFKINNEISLRVYYNKNSGNLQCNKYYTFSFEMV